MFERNLFPIFIFFRGYYISVRFQHPFFEFRVSPPDTLSIDIAVIVFPIGCVDPGKEKGIVTGIEPPAGDDNDPVEAEIFFDFPYCRKHICFFAFIAGKGVERHWDAVGVHKKPHLYDRVFAVFF